MVAERPKPAILPMELAENSPRSCRSKIAFLISGSVTLFCFLLFGIFIYNSGFWIHQEDLRTDLITITGLRSNSNGIFTKEEDINEFLQIKNEKSFVKQKRRKRHTRTEIKSEDSNPHYELKFNDNYFRKAREIIAKYENACEPGNENALCKDIVQELNHIKHQNEMSSKLPDQKLNDDTVTTQRKRQTYTPTEAMGGTKTTPKVFIKEHEQIRSDDNQYIGEPYSGPHYSTPVANNCLLARLLQQSYPDGQLNWEHLHQQLHPNHNVYQNNMPYNGDLEAPWLQTRDTFDMEERKPHPQDVEIYIHRKTLESPPKIVQIHNVTAKEADCELGMFTCDNGDHCVSEKQLCDGIVDCGDISDEIRCPCKSRIDKVRLCDGYFDCPFGEDEMGCHGCNEDNFSCENLDLNARSSCFTKEERCDGVRNCPNHKDEMECNMLAPSLHEKPLFAISHTEGYLQRNFRGNWYAVCKNPYMWAHDACLRETGIILRPPLLQMVPVDPLLKISYLSNGPGRSFQTSEFCYNSSAVYVQCPQLLCGTRLQTTSQLLRENAEIETRLFGRNRRNVCIEHPELCKNKNNNKRLHNEAEYLNQRLKRAESRVVGGTPSLPAAWPWVVALYKDGYFHCGGVVLTERWVMSAAHCVQQFWDHYYEVRVGMLRRFSYSPQEQNHKVTHIIVNKFYSHVDMKNDLTLLRVKPSIQFSRWVRPICLPSEDTAGPDWMWGPPAGTMCTAVGWGSTVEQGPDPDHMREVEVPIWHDCKSKEDRAGKEICAGFKEGGKDTCQGDSGGPLLCRNPLNSQQWYMAGIVSHGDGCARKNEPGVYTRVSMFVKWILRNIHARSLPNIRPKQECPGFRCVSGITKCLPKKRMCDKIVDCLEGEDEINCNYMRSSETVDDNIDDNILVSEDDAHIEQPKKHKYRPAMDSEKRRKLELLNKGNRASNNAVNNMSQNIAVEKERDNENNNHDVFTNQPDTSENTKDTVNTVTVSTTDITSNFESTVMSNSSFLQENLTIVDEDTQFLVVNESITQDPTEFVTDSESEISVDGNSKQLRDMEVSRELLMTTISANIHIVTETTTVTERGDTVVHESTSTENHIHTVTSNFDENHSDHNVQDITNIKHNESTTNTNTQIEELKLVDDEKEKQGKGLVIELDEKEKQGKRLDIELDEKEKQGKGLDIELDEKEIPVINNIKQLIENLNNEKHNLPLYLEPAKVKKQHHKAEHFECKRISQVIPHGRRCDRKADCEDGTDEFGCTCVDYLYTFDSKHLCDGHIDCADGQDEMNCYGCADGQFLCKHSQTCLSIEHVCDGTPQCPLGEDELECYALSNGLSVVYDFDNTPKVNLEGYLTKRNQNSWHIVCEDNMSIGEQEDAGTHICRYLGFSSANRVIVKYINMKDNHINVDKYVHKRNALEAPIQFVYKEQDDDNFSARHIVIKEPEVIKEKCVPNITKVCMSLYVFCDHALYSEFTNIDSNIDNNIIYRSNSKVLPWIAKVYVEGQYRCTGILIELSWVLISESCLWDTLLIHKYVTVAVGSHRTLSSTNGPYEQTYRVDAKKDLYDSSATLLHLKEKAYYSSLVKPMVTSTLNSHTLGKADMCVAVGQDASNTTISVFLKETTNCEPHKRCFKRISKDSVCEHGTTLNRPWTGIISCHAEQGWFPAATFIERSGECGFEDVLIGRDIEPLRIEIKHYIAHYKGNSNISSTAEESTGDDCDGMRCSRGSCIQLRNICDGVRNCEDGNDESELACDKKQSICAKDPYHRGCDCTAGQMKCKNGNCIAKELFGNGHDDCGDGSEESSSHAICAQYLARFAPHRLCDGTLHCSDRTDEDPGYCKCFSKNTYKCDQSETCVSPDLVCDGVRDCPNGEDEKTCLALRSPSGTTYGTGEVIMRTHGVWHTKCYSTPNHTRSELEQICKELGFQSGHAKQLKMPQELHPRTKAVLDNFTQVTLNENVTITLRNSNEPIAKVVLDEHNENCHPVYIECL